MESQQLCTCLLPCGLLFADGNYITAVGLLVIQLSCYLPSMIPAVSFPLLSILLASSTVFVVSQPMDDGRTLVIRDTAQIPIPAPNFGTSNY
jgi:hypothetical protein